MILVLLVSSVGAAYAYSTQGPSSSQPAYIVGVERGVMTRSILTVGDSPAGSNYRMVGIPDGLGAFDNNNGTFTLVANHELNPDEGVVRAHGATGSFISKWIINKKDLRALSGEDLIQNVITWDPVSGTYNPPAQSVGFNRFCSADLPPISAFYSKDERHGESAQAASDKHGDRGIGYRGRIFMNGEESGAEGRAFAHLMDSTSYELPRLGKFSHEHSVANPDAGRYTVVAGTDDSGTGQIYIYVGEKTRSDNPVEAAGLTNGQLYGVKVEGLIQENDSTPPISKGSFSLFSLGDVSNMSGAELEATSVQNQVTAFNRPEDGAWDPTHPNDFYFVTTASFTGKSRLWRLHFKDRKNPAGGGRIDMLLDGTEGQKMMDNLAIDGRGRVVIQEDPGNQEHIAKTWRYDARRDQLSLVAQHDPDRFMPGAPNFLTQDEESSGIIDASNVLGQGWFLLTVQAHYNLEDPELVEGGQFLALRIPPGRR